MFNIGDKVKFDEMEGYLIGINIDPLEELEIPYESCTYTIRVFQQFYKDGYADFYRSEGDLLKS